MTLHIKRPDGFRVPVFSTDVQSASEPYNILDIAESQTTQLCLRTLRYILY